MPNRVEKIARIGEIACYKQLLLFSPFFYCYISSARQSGALCGNVLKSGWTIIIISYELMDHCRFTTTYGPCILFITVQNTEPAEFTLFSQTFLTHVCFYFACCNMHTNCNDLSEGNCLLVQQNHFVTTFLVGCLH